jgi:putative ABC transport system permease protein
MLKATWRSLLAHKLRLALTGLAVVLGVAFMSGTFVLTDTIDHTFSALFAQTAAGESAVVRAVAPFGSGHGAVDRPPTPESLLSVVRSVPGVAAADGSVGGTVTLLDNHGGVVGHQAPTIASAWEPDAHLSALTIVAGHAPDGPGQVTVDSATASKEHFVLGQSLTIIGEHGPARYTLVGITRFGSTGNLAGATLVSFDLATAQSVVGRPGELVSIDVAAAPGVSTPELLAAIGSRLPQGFEVITGAQAASEQAASISSGLSQFNTFLLVFAGVALFVGAFLIFNTFSILVGQRTRELALLRAVGAGRRQVYASVLGEAFLTGLAGSAVGIGAGVGLAAGVYALLSALGIDLPRSSLVLEGRTVIVGLVVGSAVTVASAILPALRASRIPPAAGLRDDAGLAETSLRRRAAVGGAVLAAGVGVLAVGLFASAGIAAVGAGAALTFVGVAMLTPFAVPSLVAVIGRPLPALAGVTGRLGRDNAGRNPRRTAATASALMVGIALVAAIATLGQSATASFNGLFTRSVAADYVLVPKGFNGFSPAAERVVAAVPGVTAVSGIRQADIHLGRVGEQVTGVDPLAGPQVFRFDVKAGSLSALRDGDLLVDSSTARSRHLKVGQVVPVEFAAATGPVDLTVGAVFADNQFLGSYVLSNSVLDANVNEPTDQAVGLRTTSVSPPLTAALESALRGYPDIKVDTVSQFEHDQKQQVATILDVVYGLLALSVVIALIGVVNTLALSVLERTREIGLLRAVGTQRRQLRRLIRWESVVVSLIGAVLGLILGVALGAAAVSALSSSFVDTLSIPVGTIVVVLILAAAFGVAAAVLPARRAARLDILEAIHTT